MTLLEIKQKTLRLIEEINPENKYLTDDNDIQYKMNSIIDQVQNELSRIKKIPAKYSYLIDSEESHNLELKRIPYFYQLEKIVGCEFNYNNYEIVFDSNYMGEVTIYYNKYPKNINYSYEKEEDTAQDSNYKFELSQDVLEILPYGVAHHILLADPVSEYGGAYGKEYQRMLSMIDPRYGITTMYIEGGI